MSDKDFKVKNGLEVTDNITVGGTVAGRDLATDGSKLDNIEANATGDQSDAEIKSAYEANSDTNVLTDALQSKLNGVATGADVTSSNIIDEDTMTTNSATKIPTQQSVKAYVDTQVAGVVDAAPGALNTLNELAAAINDDSSFATTVNANIASKLPLAGGTLTGNIVMGGAQTVDGRDLSADGTKLDGIEASADVTDTTNVVAALTAGTNVAISAGGTISSTDTNTTYSVGDGGLTQKNFTTADNTKLDGIATSANNYSLPVAAPTVLGGVKEGGDIAIDASGVMTVNDDSHNHTVANVDGLQTALDAKTTPGYVDTQITNLIGGAPGTLDTLNELAAAINDDAAYASTLTTSLATKTAKTSNQSLSTAANAMTISGHTITLNRGDGTTDTVTVPDNNTTYSVGDGGLTQVNFTTADNTKLDGIEASADVTDTTNVVAALTAGTNVAISAGGTISSTDTNTTYSADGNYGMTLSGTAFRLEDDRRRNSTTTDIYSGNTSDYTFYDADVGIRWYTAGAEDMRLTDAGDLHVDGNVTAYSTTVSDRNLKTDIEKIDNALEKVNKLNGCTFTYTSDGKESAGLIAQEVEEVLPSAVTTSKLVFHGEEGKEYKVLQYDQTIGLLVEAIKELSVKVEELENK